MIDNTGEKFLLDIYNLKGERNEFNTDKNDYNCGGYALGIFSWLFPCNTEDEKNKWFLNKDKNSDFNYGLEASSEWMLSNIPNLRKIDSPYDILEKNEWVVGFKIGVGSGCGDFHFIRKSNNRFLHKIGPCDITYMDEIEALSDSWCNGGYTSKTIWFAKK